MRVKIGKWYQITNKEKNLYQIGLDPDFTNKIVFVHKKIEKSKWFNGQGYQVIIDKIQFLYELRAKDLVKEI